MTPATASNSMVASGRDSHRTTELMNDATITIRMPTTMLKTPPSKSAAMKTSPARVHNSMTPHMYRAVRMPPDRFTRRNPLWWVGRRHTRRVMHHIVASVVRMTATDAPAATAPTTLLESSHQEPAISPAYTTCS